MKANTNLAQKVQPSVAVSANIVFACELYKQAVLELEVAEAKVKATKQIMKLHLQEEGLLKDEHQGVKFQLIAMTIVTTYDKKTLEILVSEEILKKARKESLRDEYIRVVQ